MEHSAGIIPYYQGRYLLVRTRAGIGVWSFPKGHLEKGETRLEAAKRELFEETSLTANIIDGFEESICYVMNDRGDEKTDTYFLGIVKDKTIKIDEEEIQDHHWCTLAEALTLMQFENTKQVIKKAHAFLQKASNP